MFEQLWITLILYFSILNYETTIATISIRIIMAIFLRSNIFLLLIILLVEVLLPKAAPYKGVDVILDKTILATKIG